MQTEITPKFFRHSKFESFVRQLNLYGFRKIKGQGRLRFTHSILLNGQPYPFFHSDSCLFPTTSAPKSKGTLVKEIAVQSRNNKDRLRKLSLKFHRFL